MSVRLRPMTDEELDEWLGVMKLEYIDDRVRMGESREFAEESAGVQFAELFPDDRPDEGQLCFRVVEVDEDRGVGVLWIGPRRRNVSEQFWVWDVRMDESERGKGYGRATMLLAEDAARAAGAKTLGLNVFGHNKVARHLYESLGYEPLAVQMQKDL